MARNARYEDHDASEPGVEPAHYEYADAPATQEYEDDADYSDCMEVDDGYNAFRVKRTHEQLVQADTDALIEYVWTVMSEKKKLTEAYEERKRAMQAQIDACEKALRHQLEARGGGKRSIEFPTDNGEMVAVYVAPSHETHYKVEDWEALYGWIAENQAYDTLQKRVSERNMKDYMDQLAAMVDAGDITPDQAVVPGVSLVTVPILSVTTRRVKPKAK